MAISDINLQVKTEHDTGFLSKESEANDHASGLSFLTELSEASEAVHSKTVANKQSDNSNVMQSEAEQAGGVVANNTDSKQVSDKPTRDDEGTDVALIEGCSQTNMNLVGLWLIKSPPQLMILRLLFLRL